MKTSQIAATQHTANVFLLDVVSEEGFGLHVTLV